MQSKIDPSKTLGRVVVDSIASGKTAQEIAEEVIRHSGLQAPPDAILRKHFPKPASKRKKWVPATPGQAADHYLKGHRVRTQPADEKGWVLLLTFSKQDALTVYSDNAYEIEVDDV